MEEIKNILPKSLKSLIPSDVICKPFDPIEIYNNSQGDLNEYDCPKCKNKGVIYFRDGPYESCRDCECMKIRRSIRRIEKSGLKDLIKKCTFNNFLTENDFQKSIKDKALNYINDFNGKWFFIGGQVGCGKTHICTAIVRKLLIGFAKPTKYLQWRNELTKIKSKFNSDEYENIIKLWKKIEVLYIDDLFKMNGSIKPTAADVNIAFEILNYRYANPNLITVISSERMINEIIEIDEAVGSRIYEKSGEYCLNIKKDLSKNYRLRSLKGE